MKHSGQADTLQRRKEVLLFTGFASFIAWQQVTSYLYLIRDVSPYNHSSVVSVIYILSLFLLIAINRFSNWFPDRTVILVSSCAATSFCLLFFFTTSDITKLVCFSLQTICSLFLMLAWGLEFSRLHHKQTVTFACGALLASCVMCALGDYLFASAVLLVGAFFPLLSGLCFFLLKRNCRNCIANPNVGADNGRISKTAFPQLKEKIKKLPWVFLSILFVCCIASSLFKGLALHPYIINSQTITQYMFGITSAFSLGILIWSLVGRKAQHQFIIDTSLLIALALFIVGLLLFSTGILQSLTLPLGIILTASNCFYIICWISFPRLIHDQELPFVPFFLSFTFASGFLYCQYLGVSINKGVGTNFSLLTLIATLCIAFLAIFYFLHINMRTRTKIQEEKGREDYSTKNIQEIIRARQREALARYNLTEREHQVMLLLLDGRTFGGIAETLYISERTVKFHSKNAYGKLGVHSKREALQLLNTLQEDDTRTRS